MIDPTQFVYYVIRPTLDYLQLGGKAAEQLLLGTALTESRLVYLHQQGSGPALGVYQMEPFTHNDLWATTVHGDLETRIIGLLGVNQQRLPQVITNLAYATAMCRVHYLRIKAKLPEAGDIDAMANYWKKYYNTNLGAGVPANFSQYRDTILKATA